MVKSSSFDYPSTFAAPPPILHLLDPLPMYMYMQEDLEDLSQR